MDVVTGMVDMVLDRESVRSVVDVVREDCFAVWVMMFSFLCLATMAHSLCARDSHKHFIERKAERANSRSFD